MKPPGRLITTTIFSCFLSSLLYLGVSGGVQRAPLSSFLCYALGHILLYVWVFCLGPNFSGRASRDPVSVPLEDNAHNKTNPARRTLVGTEKKSHLHLSRWYGPLPEFLFSTTGVVVVAIVLRLVFTTYPISDDVYRYAWEGFIQSKSVNPYLHPPSEFATEYGCDPVYRGINHKELPAIYPPLSLVIFRGISAWFYTPNELSIVVLGAYKFFFICCDILTIILGIRLLKIWQRPAYWLALYAWNPLVILYGSGEAHIDVLQNVFIAALLLNLRQKEAGFRWGFFLLGCAVMTKYLSIILLPFLMTRKNFRNVPFFFIPFLLFFLYWDHGFFFSLLTFSSEFHYNDVLPRLLRSVVNGPVYHSVLLAVFVGGVVWIWLIREETVRAIQLAWMWMLVCLPTIHPWYVMPLALLLLHIPNSAWLTLMTTMGMSFWVYHHQWQTGDWVEFSWVWCATYLPFFAVLIRDFGRIDLPWLKRYALPASIDIIIPVLNDEQQLKTFLPALRKSIDRLTSSAYRDVSSDTKSQKTHEQQSPTCRVLIVDGGSTDNTLATAAEGRATILRTSYGSRGKQLATGIQAGSGDIVLMLHADAMIDEMALERLYDRFLRSSTLEWGIMGHVYDMRTIKMRIIEISNRLRFFFTGIAFGDQGIFLRRELLDAAGGMSTLPLMEDVELSLRLARFPCRMNLGPSLVVSTRRWKKRNFTGYTFQVLRLVMTFLVRRRLGYDTNTLANALYTSYYDRRATLSTHFEPDQQGK